MRNPQEAVKLGLGVFYLRGALRWLHADIQWQLFNICCRSDRAGFLTREHTMNRVLCEQKRATEREQRTRYLQRLELPLLLFDFLCQFFPFVLSGLLVFLQNTTWQILFLFSSVTPKTKKTKCTQYKPCRNITLACSIRVTQIASSKTYPIKQYSVCTCPESCQGSWDTPNCLGSVCPQHPSGMAAFSTLNIYLKIHRRIRVRVSQFLKIQFVCCVCVCVCDSGTYHTE